jgi:hypothetical protein
MIAHDKSQARVGAPYVRGCTHAFCGCYDLRDEDGVYVNGAAIDDATSVLDRHSDPHASVSFTRSLTM